MLVRMIFAVLYVSGVFSQYSYRNPRLEYLNNTRSLSVSMMFDIIPTASNPNVIYFLTSHSVWELNLQMSPADERLIAGAQTHSYQEGVGHDARFYYPNSLRLRNASHAVIADMLNHCVREVDLHTGATSRFAAQCTNKGYRDGDKWKAHMAFPAGIEVVGDRVFVTEKENGAVRMVSGDLVCTLAAGSPLNRPNFLDHLLGMLYITIDHGVVSLNLTDNTTKLVSGLPFDKEFDYHDGNLISSRFNYPRSILALTDTVILVADIYNNNLRVINLSADEVTTICTAETTFRTGGRHHCAVNKPRSMMFYGDDMLISAKDKLAKLTGLDAITGFYMTGCPDNIEVEIEFNQLEVNISWTEPRVDSPSPEHLECDFPSNNETFKPGVHYMKYICYYFHLTQTCRFTITVVEKCLDDINLKIPQSQTKSSSPVIINEDGLGIAVYSGLMTLTRDRTIGSKCVQTVSVSEEITPGCSDDISLKIPDEVDHIALILPQVEIPVDWFCTDCPETVQILTPGHHQFIYNYIKLSDIAYTVLCNMSVFIYAQNTSTLNGTVPLSPADKQQYPEEPFACQPLAIGLGVLCLLLVVVIIIIWCVRKQPQSCRSESRSVYERLSCQGQLFTPTDTSKAFNRSSFDYLDRDLYALYTRPNLDTILNGRTPGQPPNVGKRPVQISLEKPNLGSVQSVRGSSRRLSISNPVYEDPDEFLNDEKNDKVDEWLDSSSAHNLPTKRSRRGSVPY